MKSEPTCAVWYVRWGHTHYDLCGSEEDAAWEAYYTESRGDHVLGVQFADGRLVKRDDWEAYQHCWEEGEQRQESTEPTPAPPKRSVADPFKHASVSIPVDAPAWLGQEAGMTDTKAAYLVIVEPGGLFACYLDRDLATRQAEAVEGVLVEVPVLADYRIPRCGRLMEEQQP